MTWEKQGGASEYKINYIKKNQKGRIYKGEDTTHVCSCEDESLQSDLSRLILVLCAHFLASLCPSSLCPWPSPRLEKTARPTSPSTRTLIRLTTLAGLPAWRMLGDLHLLLRELLYHEGSLLFTEKKTVKTSKC